MNIIRNLPKVAILLGLLSMVMGGVLLAACQPTAETQVEAQPDVNCPLPQEIEPMDLPETGAIPDATIPPTDATIPPTDASAPTKTETATFSLG